MSPSGPLVPAARHLPNRRRKCTGTCVRCLPAMGPGNSRCRFNFIRRQCKSGKRCGIVWQPGCGWWPCRWCFAAGAGICADHQSLKKISLAPTYRIVIERKSQLLLRFLKIRVIVDGMAIYPLEPGKPITVALKGARPRLVVTDGYHYTKPQELVLQHIYIYYFKVVCAIEDDQLIVGFILLVLFYTAGLTSDILLLKAMSFLPLLYFLMVYYKDRASFLQLKPA